MVRIRIVCSSDDDHNREFDIPDGTPINLEDTCDQCQVMAFNYTPMPDARDAVIGLLLLDLLS